MAAGNDDDCGQLDLSELGVPVVKLAAKVGLLTSLLAEGIETGEAEELP